MRPLRRRLAIRTRLAVIYAGLLAAALVAFGAGVYVVLHDELERSFDSSLISNAEHAGVAFAQDINPTGQLQPTSRLIAQFAATGGRVVVLDPAGRTLIDSAPPASSELALTKDDLAVADRHAHIIRELAAGGDVIRLIVEPVIVPGGAQVGYVAWAESTRPLRDLLGTVSGALLIAGLLVTVSALAGGLVLARRALAPVTDVTDTARAISLSGDFAARVAVAFNEMLIALEQNHHALQGFLGDASHELRTPLTTIRANLDLARRPGLPDDERRAILGDAADEAERMGRLIADLLSLARAESGVRLELRPVELDALLVESVRRHRQSATHVRMGVTSVEPAVVDGDRDRLRELFGILLDNAARYTPAGGNVAAALKVQDNRAIVRVEDSGIGLDEHDRERAFERLYRGAQAREMRPSGTGLGLAIARWIVESHAGTITLTGREGGGTVVTVTLPVRRS
jgi:two-component system OmpR family sensor kinase